MKRDMFQECYSSAPKEVSTQEFQQTFCAHCRNTECSLAQWSQDRFTARVSTQAERLFNPSRIDPLTYGAQVPNFVDKANAPNAVRRDWTAPTGTGVLPVPLMGNTVTPQGGIILGGGEIPASPTRPVVKHDPWDASTKVVKPGARIQLGGKKP